MVWWSMKACTLHEEVDKILGKDAMKEIKNPGLGREGILRMETCDGFLTSSPS